MKLHILPADLSAALDVASKTVGKRGENPTLMGVLLEALPDGGLRCTGTDIERRAWHTVSARVDEAGSVVLPPGPLQEFVKNVSPDDGIEITVNDKHRATLVSGQTKVGVSGLDPEPFPVGPDLEDPMADFTMAAGDFARLLKHTLHATAPADKTSKPTLAGVMLSNLDGPLLAKAADSFRAAMDGVDVETEGEFNVSALAPGLAECVKHLGAATSARIILDAKLSVLVVDCESGSWATRLLSGTIPEFTPFLRFPTTCTVTMSREALSRAVKLVRSVEEGIAGAYRFRVAVTSDGLELWAGDDSADRTARTVVPATVEGEFLTTIFNSAYFADGVGAIDTPDVVIEFSGVQTPALMRPAGERGRHLQILIPLQFAQAKAE